MARLTHGPCELASGYFFGLAVISQPNFEVFKEDFEAVQADGPLITSFGDGAHDDFYPVELVGSDVAKIPVCVVDETHTVISWRDLQLDIGGGEHPSPLIPLTTCEPVCIVSKSLHDQLQSSGLRGIEFERVSRVIFQGTDRDPAEAEDYTSFRLVSEDPCRARAIRRVEPPGANSCPFCGAGPLVCEGCGRFYSACRVCGEKAFVDEADVEPNNRRIILPDGWQRTVINVKDWNGADFSGEEEHACIVTRRFVDLLLSVHAYPFVAVPIYANAIGTSPEKQELLERSLHLPA